MQSYFGLIHMLSNPLKISKFMEYLLDFAKKHSIYRVNNKNTCTSMKYELHNYMRQNVFLIYGNILQFACFMP